MAEPSSSEEEEEDDDDEESDGDKPRKKSKGGAKGGGRGRPKKVGGQQVTSTSPPKPKGVKPVDNIVSCEATSTTGVPAVAAATPTEKEFTVSSFKIPAVATPTEKEFTVSETLNSNSKFYLYFYFSLIESTSFGIRSAQCSPHDISLRMCCTFLFKGH